jgi:hypothetical protein
LFEVVNTPSQLRQSTLDESLAAFPYINGKLFAEQLPSAAFDRAMREALLDCCALDWSQISPAIFGSLFQSIMDPEMRRGIGAHYTSEANILKVVRTLFLDDLWDEFRRIDGLKRGTMQRMHDFHDKLAGLRFLDPACGCGNFLVVAYRELRLLELAVIRSLHGKAEQVELSATLKGVGLVRVDVDQFYGIELEEFPAQIAQVAMWLTDHQMNLHVSQEFGRYFVRLPLIKSANVWNANALTEKWETVLAPSEASFILGNPPFAGKKEQSLSQKVEMARVWQNVSGAGVLDYVTAWYWLAVRYLMANPAVRVAFVSTNSITQGEQVAALWGPLLGAGVRVHFAHRTFQWSSEAPGVAAVHCVIIGFGLDDVDTKWLFEYERPTSSAHAVKVSKINPYLADAPNVLVTARTRPLQVGTARANYGSMPIDDGHLILTADEVDALGLSPAQRDAYVRRYGGGDEAISGQWRYCLWLGACSPGDLRTMPGVLERVRRTKEFRCRSTRKRTVSLADTPTLFGEMRQPNGTYLLIPKVSSVYRQYIPLSFHRPTEPVNSFETRVL